MNYDVAERRVERQWLAELQQIVADLGPRQSAAVLKAALLGEPLKNERLRDRVEAVVQLQRAAKALLASLRARREGDSGAAPPDTETSKPLADTNQSSESDDRRA